MKLSTTAVLFLLGAGTAVTVDGAPAAAATVALPSRIPLDVKIHKGKVCGDEEDGAYVQVYAELESGKSIPCGKTRAVGHSKTPTWNEKVSCGDISRADWNNGAKVHFQMRRKDTTLGQGSKTFQYGQGSTGSIQLGSSSSSECGPSLVYFSVETPIVSTKLCVQSKPDGDFQYEEITGSYYTAQQTLAAYEAAKGVEVGYPGGDDVKTVRGSPVKLDENCNLLDPSPGPRRPLQSSRRLIYITYCVRRFSELGNCERKGGSMYGNPTQAKIDNQISYLRYQENQRNYNLYLPGDEVEYLTGKGIVQTDCTVDPVEPTSYGDPHFKTWTGEQFDFHGGCDLVLVHNPQFNHGLGMNIHVRTKIHSWWSLIESAAISIGDNTLQVTGGTGSIKYWINGKEKELKTGDASMGDFHVAFHRVNDHQSQTRVDLGNHADAISIETYKDYVRVNVKDKKQISFDGSTGLWGSYPFGEKVGRDGKTKFEDDNAFGQEWMVRPTSGDAILFHDVDAAAAPLECTMPKETTKEGRRRLGESVITEEEAALTCSRVGKSDRDACISDVLATNDRDIAGSY